MKNQHTKVQKPMTQTMDVAPTAINTTASVLNTLYRRANVKQKYDLNNSFLDTDELRTCLVKLNIRTL